jgi:ppGpp synthetase/RelA/SpoT-type nucleotidyltranferase
VLTREQVAEITARFADQRPSFERVAGEVHRLTNNLLHGRALKSVVTSRAKSLESLARTLWRDRDKWSIGDFEAALAPPLADLAGVRVLLYREIDVEPARAALLGEFSPLKEKDKRSSTGYSAYHLVVQDWCSEDDPEFGPLRRLPCEIQICTIVEHVWNELEHDIVYKQPGGRPDLGQVEMLKSLRAELGLCAGTVERLMTRTDDRARENKEPLEGPRDLRRYLELRLNRRVDGAFDELWDFLSNLLDRLTPKHLDNLFDEGRTLEAARALCERMDPDRAHRDIGLVGIMLLPAFPAADVQEIAGTNPDAPLWKFFLRVVNSTQGDKV